MIDKIRIVVISFVGIEMSLNTLHSKTVNGTANEPINLTFALSGAKEMAPYCDTTLIANIPVSNNASVIYSISSTGFSSRGVSNKLPVFLY